MASTSRTIRVRFDGDAKGISDATTRSIRDFTRFGKKIKKTNEDLGRKSGRGFSGSFGDALKASFKRTIPSFMSDFGSTFTSGLKGVLSSPVVGPIIVAALAGVAVAASGLVATIIGGAIIAGAGAGLVGMGILFASQNEKVKKQWSDTFADIKKIMMDAAEPLLPVLNTARKSLKDLAKFFAPVLKAGFSLASGPLKGFIRDLEDGLKELKPAIDPIMAAFANILRSIGPQLPGIFRSISTSLVSLAKAVGDNSDIFAAFIIAVTKFVAIGIDAITWLINAFRGIIDITFQVASAALGMADKFLGSLETIAGALAKIPGPWQASFRKMQKSIREARGDLAKWKTDVDNAPKILKLRGDIRDLDTKLARARSQLKDPNLTKERRAKLNADIRELLRKKRQAQNAINSLRGKTVFIKTEYQSTLSRNALRQATGARATGGPVAMGRTYLVGERGPELFTAPSNGNIIPNNRLGEGGDTNVNVFIDGREFKGMIRSEISESNRNTKRRALAA